MRIPFVYANGKRVTSLHGPTGGRTCWSVSLRNNNHCTRGTVNEVTGKLVPAGDRGVIDAVWFTTSDLGIRLPYKHDAESWPKAGTERHKELMKESWAILSMVSLPPRLR